MLILLLLIAFGSIFVYWKVIRPASYWKRKGVRQGREIYLFGDSFGSVTLKFSLATLIEHNYNKFSNERYCGLYQFQMPTLMIRDPDLLKQLTVKDFDHFTDHSNVIEDEPLWSKNLFVLRGEEWRDMRATLSPAFTSSKMRGMFNLMDECAKTFISYLDKNTDAVTTYDTKDLFTRYSNDVIATCAFGVTCNSLKDKDNQFFRMGQLVTDFGSYKNMMKLTLLVFMPRLYKMLGMTVFSKQVKVFFDDLVLGNIRIREEQHIIRPDMIHLLMEAKKGSLKHFEEKETVKETGFATVEESPVGVSRQCKKREITDDDMTAQALIFFFAGFDSGSTVMCFAAHELAVNPDIQDRLREEVDCTLADNNGVLTYESIAKMQYMDMVVSETLRLWPAAALFDRVCVKPYTIKAERSGETDVHLDKGDILWTPVFGFHRDPEYYPNPTKFDPERFNAVNKNNIKPYTYLPFGAGPRACIGSRFALMEIKLILVHLMSKFIFEVVEKTQIPIVIKKQTGFAMIPENGFWLGLKKRN